MGEGTTPSTLRRALTRYVDARAAALVEARRALQIGDGDARALLFIADNPGARATQLRDHLGITAAGVTALIGRLVDRDIVRRDVDTNDRRVVRITALVDVDVDPWSALTRFDADFDGIIAAGDTGQTDAMAAMLDSLTEATAHPAR